MAFVPTLVATAGQLLGLPEWTISEWLGGTTTQTKPIYTRSGLLGSGGYVRSPIPDETSVYSISEGKYTSGPYKGQNAVESRGDGGSGGETTTDSSSSGSTGGTSGGSNGDGGVKYISPDEAMKMGMDVNNPWPGYQIVRPESGGGSNVDAERIRSNINEWYNNYIANLDRQAGLLPTYEQEDVGRIESAYSALMSGIGQEKMGAEQKLDIARQNVLANKQASMQEIEQNLRNLLKATGMTLGAMGAGSSSAAEVILPYALSKQGARASAQVLAQANQQLGEIDQKMVDVQNIYNQEKNKLDLWKTERLQDIANTYRAWKDRIEAEKRNAEGTRLEALNALDFSLLQNALAMSNWYEQQAANYQAAVDQWARDRLAQLNNFKLQIQQSSAFEPQELVYGELKGLSGLPQGTEGTFMNPYLLSMRRRQQLGFPTY